VGDLAVINIGIDPNIFSSGGFIISWHGFFTALGILTVILWARWQGQKYRIDEDAIYGTAIWAILGGIVGARLIHVIDFWDIYSQDPVAILRVWTGGIGLIGGILGATLVGSAYAWRNRYPLGRMVDLLAPGLLIGQAVGRIGDIINGEHLARLSNSAWSFQYTHPGSPAFGQNPMHPAIAYEMALDGIIFMATYWLINRLRPDGMVFITYLAMYSLGRFFIQFIRRDAVWFAGLQEAHILTLALMLVSVVILATRARFGSRAIEVAPTGS
jgi:phosphatidylglycerol:prolipoprotein diacylglycerol transferase